MKHFLGLRGLFLLLYLAWIYADDWSAIKLQCTNHWFYLRIKATIFPKIYMNPDEAFLGIGCPVTYVWPNDFYDFTYRTYSCGIVNKVLYEVTLLETKIKYISKNSTTRAEMRLSCVLHSRYPLFCEAESKGNFTGNPPEWAVDLRTDKRINQASSSTVRSSCSPNDGHLLDRKRRKRDVCCSAEK